MQAKKIAYVLANFGGPRSTDEIYPFLESLLTDREVIRTRLPKVIHQFLFRRVAKKRAVKVSKEYASIGGKSPIYQDTEELLNRLRPKLGQSLVAFHRYLPATHAEFIKKIHEMDCEEIRIFPLFPQFTYATTGSVALWFDEFFPTSITSKMRWIKSYPAYPTFIEAHQKKIRHFLDERGLKDEETILLFSAHGIPQKFVDTGDLYQDECVRSYQAVMQAFPEVLGRLSFQSRFGNEEWIKPYTIDVCEDIKNWNQGRKNIVFIPISFTSDHIETLVEIENEYMSVIREMNLQAYRVPCLTHDPLWIQTICELFDKGDWVLNQMLIRHK